MAEAYRRPLRAAGHAAGVVEIRRPGAPRLRLLSAVVLVAVVAVLGAFGAGSARTGSTGTFPASPGPSAGAQPLVAPTGGTAAFANATIAVTPTPATVCPTSWPTCPSGSDTSRVSAQLTLPSGPLAPGDNESQVQVLFLLETTPYDGAYDGSAYDPGRDACANGGGHLCEESNLDHTFAAYSGTIASAVAAAHPGIPIAFGLVDYFATISDFDDGDGYSFHVDVGNFTSASNLPAEVNATLTGGSAPVLSKPSMTMPDSDLSDSFLTSSEITALYGALYGAGVNWSTSAHHVLELLGSTAPRDPNYSENYCASSSDYAGFSPCLGSTCEPSFNYGAVTSPACVGWVVAQSPTAGSIAGDAVNATACTASLGARCTIDALDVWDTPTDPASKGWPSTSNATTVRNDSLNILRAGCDLAVATGGSWNGPSFYTCNGTAGSLSYANYTTGSADLGIIRAIGNLSLGASFGAVGAYVSAPTFRLVLAPGVALASAPEFAVDCAAGSGASNTSCAQVPSVANLSGTTVLAWNWSTLGSADLLMAGDAWTVSLTLAPMSSASGTMPLFRCELPSCSSAGAGPIAGAASSVTGFYSVNATPWSVAVPLVTWTVVPYPTLAVALAIPDGVGEAPFAVAATASVTGGYLDSPVALAWGDGGQSVGSADFQHRYTAPGSYPVLASVSDSLGQAAWATSTVEVYPSLYASINANATYGVAPFEPSLVAAATGGDGPYSYTWTLAGASSTGTSLAPTLAAGTWTVDLSVRDGLGYTANSSLLLTVVAPPATSPVGGPGGNGGNGGGGATPTPGGAGGLSMGWVLVGLGAVVVASAAAVLVARTRGRRKGPGPVRSRQR